MDTQSTYVSQSALYSTTGGAEGEASEARTATSSLHTSRSFFIIDKSRMVGERDTVEGAKVVYLPESEFKKELYLSRCSCLVGVADVYRNMTGEFPQSLAVAGCCYACQLLESNYFMFLLGRPLEPSERVLSTLQHISDIFHFYFHSPESVMKKSRGDWQTFTANMSFIFSRIREYVFRDPHSISFMFHTLPYYQRGHQQKRSRLFLQASHILRSCQQQESIVGGCIMYNTEIVCNQLSSQLTEKLQVVGGKGIELNTKSVLAENLAPETVWVLEVYLSPEEVEDLADAQRDLARHREAYEGMTPNPTLVDSAVCSRFRPPTAPAVPPSSSSSSSSRSGPTRSGWRVGRSSSSGRRVRSRAVEPNPEVDEDYYNVSVAFNSLTTGQKGAEASGRSGKSDNVVTFSSNGSTVTVLPQLTQTSPQVSRGRGRGRGRGRAEPDDRERSRLGSNRAMPRLHGATERRDLTQRPYANPDSFPDISSQSHEAVHEVSKSRGKSPPLPPRLDVTCSPASSIPASLTIPIPTGKPANGGQSPLMSGTDGSSSLEEERFATPSPNFSLMASAAFTSKPVEAATRVSLPVSVAQSFQTADELSDSSHSPSLPEQQQQEQDTANVEKKVKSIYSTLTPPLPQRASPQTHHSRLKQQLEESSDFVDSEVLDLLLSEIRLSPAECEALQPQPHSAARAVGAGNGGDQVYIDCRDSPPALPPRNYEIGVEPPPPLPPRSLSALSAASLVEVEPLVGNSGEFTVVEFSPPSVPRRTPPQNWQQSVGAESIRPPSPPPRIHSRKWSQLPQIPDSTPQSDPSSVLDPSPAPPPKPRSARVEEREVMATASGGKDRLIGDLPERSVSSSPDHQHRGLTQSQGEVASSEEGAEEEEEEEEEEGRVSGEGQDMETVRESVKVIEGRGWLGEVKSEASAGGKGDTAKKTPAEEDPSRRRHSSSSVDPVKTAETPLTGSLREDGVDESSSITSTVRILTSDEDEEEEGEGSDNEITASVKAVNMRYRHPSTSTPCERGVRTTAGLDESLSMQSLRLDTPGGTGAMPSLSFTQLNTPEMTLQLSMADRLRGTADDQGQGGGGGGEGVRSQAAMVASDMARIHQTLSRQLQPPAAQPVPPLETWCLYVQRQFNTVVVLVAKAGLQNNHSLLTQLWKSLLPQLFALDQGLEPSEEHESNKSSYNLAVYHNTDRYCAVEARKALYKFRHAVRFTHLEYKNDPDLCQITLLNAPKMVSQRVMGREVYYHHQRSIAADVFTATALVTKTARQTTYQPLSGHTPAHFL